MHKSFQINNLFFRFMESPLSLPRTHWDHEPTRNPSQEGNGQGPDERLLPSWEGLGVGRFMERASEGRIRRASERAICKFICLSLY